MAQLKESACNAADLGWEDPLEGEMATHSSTLVWRIPLDRGAWQATVHGVAQLNLTEAAKQQQYSEFSV